ncbi:hypothetical protein HF251_28545 [Rhizobium leguminosarum]|nr:hypothetical protein [Rhizobium leguminosarum]
MKLPDKNPTGSEFCSLSHELAWLRPNRSFVQPRSRNRVRHQECGNLRDDVDQMARIVCNAFNESAPLPLLLLVLAKGVR